MSKSQQDGVYLVYPERRYVTAQRIREWYLDAVADQRISIQDLKRESDSLEQMCRALEYIGDITRGQPR